MGKLFSIDQEKINEIVLRAHRTMQNSAEAKRLRRFMPQWNLPDDFENTPSCNCGNSLIGILNSPVLI